MKTINKLSKVNETIKYLLDEVNTIEEYEARNDFNTRDGKIVSNIKVYEWIDEDDVKDVIQNENLEQLQESILEEFNSERLINIKHHVSETEISHLKERFEENVDLNNYEKQAILYGTYKAGNITPEDRFTTKYKYYIESFEAFKKRKNNTQKDYLTHLIKQDPQGYKELKRRQLINFECWQYGRSGGWFSICDADELENCESDFFNLIDDLDNTEDNNEFNEILRDHNYFSEDKRQLIKDIEEFINEWNERKEAIQHYVKEVEESTKYFKSILKEQLSYEIDTFIQEDLNFENSNCKISIEDNKVKTTLGVSVNLEEFKTAFNNVIHIFKNLKQGEKAPIKKHVGGYFVEYAKKVESDILIKAGCHKFSLNNINKVLQA